MTRDYVSPTALVTGGAAGIGLAIVTNLRDKGYRVMIADRDLAVAQQVVAELGPRVEAVACDVSRTDSVEDALKVLHERYDRLDSLFTCAGVANPGPSHELTDEDFAGLLDIHLQGMMRCCRAAFPLLSHSRGAIVGISSVGARLGMPERLGYSAAKAGVESVVRTLAVEWAPAGVRVNAVAPGYTLTGLNQALIEQGKLHSAKVVARVPLGRFAAPEEIAAAAVFLGSPESSYITGQTLVVDGGMTIEGDWY